MKNTFNNEKKLPKIYKTKVNTENNKKCFYSKNENIKNTINSYKELVNNSNNNCNNKTVKEKINNLIKPNTMYSNELTLILKNKKIRTRIIRKYDNYILTIDNEKIKYDDILEILE